MNNITCVRSSKSVIMCIVLTPILLTFYFTLLTESGAHWLRRGSQNLRGMPRGNYLVNPTAKTLVANDDNYALAA